MNGLGLDDDCEAVLLRYARAFECDIERDRFFRATADLLRPRQHIGIEVRDVHRAAHEARRLVLGDCS